MFSYVTLEQRVPQDHPLREIRRLTDLVLRSLNQEFDSLYSASGRPSIAPEYVLRALLQMFYTIRSDRQLVEQLDYNLLFRWFVGLGMDDAVWNHAVFSKNRDRLLNSEVAQQFFAAVLELAKPFMSDDHFTVDGTLIQARASQKSFRRKDGSNPDGATFHGEKRSNETHESSSAAPSRITSTRLYLGNFQAPQSRDFSVDDDRDRRGARNGMRRRCRDPSPDDVGSVAAHGWRGRRYRHARRL
jgi:transposase